MKAIIYTIAIVIAMPLIGFSQSANNAVRTTHKSYSASVTGTQKSKKAKNNKKVYKHMNYVELKSKPSYKEDSGFTFRRQKSKNPQNSYSYNW